MGGVAPRLSGQAFVPPLIAAYSPGPRPGRWHRRAPHDWLCRPGFPASGAVTMPGGPTSESPSRTRSPTRGRDSDADGHDTTLLSVRSWPESPGLGQKWRRHVAPGPGSLVFLGKAALSLRRRPGPPAIRQCGPYLGTSKTRKLRLLVNRCGRAARTTVFKLVRLGGLTRKIEGTGAPLFNVISDSGFRLILYRLLGVRVGPNKI